MDCFFEIGKHPFPRPRRRLAKEVAPVIVVLLGAANGHHGVDCGAASYQLSDEKRESPVLQRCLGHGGDVVEELRLADLDAEPGLQLAENGRVVYRVC